MDSIESLASKLPGGLRTAPKNFAVTKHTAIFKAFNRLVNHGNFVAKVVLYEPEMCKGREQREVLDEHMEEFVQYDWTGGRAREALAPVM